jgi:energy-coupling factor transporter ATP-binding protein EcfA2
MNLVEIILNGNCFIAGSRGCGKSSLAMLLADLLKNNGARIVVIDSSRTWLKRSSLPYFVKTPKPTSNPYSVFYHWDFKIPNEDIIFDVSRLNVFELREFTCGFLENIFNVALELDEHGIRPQVCVIVEEVQNLIPNSSLRSMAYQEISRYITQGRNYHCSIIGISQRLASVDTNLVENCDLRYIGRTNGDNNLRKLRGFGISKKDITTIQNLPKGKFLMHYGTSTSIEDVPYFKSPIKPQQYIEPQKPKKPTLIQRIMKAVKGDRKNVRGE